MKRSTLGTVLAFATMLAGCAEVEPYKGPERFITIGTGGLTGVYYPTGGAICRLVNKRRREHGIRCSVESTAGSVYNINNIRANELEMAVAQSDWQYHAYKGTGRNSFIYAGPFTELRSVFSVHPEPVTVIARADAGIEHIDDLVGKRVNIGNPGSGTEATWTVLWRAMGHPYAQSDLELAMQLRSAETPGALCDNRIDALFWLVGHPNGLSKQATTTCDAVMVEVSGPAVDGLVKANSFYRYATIPGGMYRGNPNDTKVFGVGATIVTSTSTPPDVIYWVVKSVFDDLGAFRRLHPAFANLKEKEMVRDSLSAPLHEGALKYYKEAGLM